jgi:two-component system sensor histidine kinase KdpD
MSGDEFPSVRSWLAWLALTALLTAVMFYAAAYLGTTHIALLYLLPVLFASAYAGRRIGFVTALLTFACFNFFFLPPRYTLRIADPRDWLVLATYLVTAFVATDLFHRARVNAAAAAARVETDRMKDALLTTVSHDLRTPLTAIKAAAADLAADGDERAAGIVVAVDHLDRLVADLLDMSRIKMGELTVTPELNAAEDLIGAALQQVTPVTGLREIDVSIDSSAPLLVGRFDFVYALRILVNLIENAHKYSPAGTSIVLSATRDAAELIFRVEDSGPGIPETDHDRIYEPFFRLDQDGGATEGTGLGLSISRRLAELQRGSLSHEPRPGGGTAFVLRLPAANL